MTPAVVVNADSRDALPVVRALGRHGVPVIGLFRRMPGFRAGRAAVHASRYLTLAAEYDGPNYETALIAALLCTAARRSERPVLFPVSGRDVIAVSRAREALEPYFRFLLPPHEMLETLLDPAQRAQRTELLGLTEGQRFTVQTVSEAEIALERATLPCRLTRARPAEGAGAPWIAHTREALHAALQEAVRVGAPIVAEEIVDGSESETFSTFSYFDAESRLLGFAACREHAAGRQSNEPLPIASLEAASRSISARLGLVGCVRMAFKRDASEHPLEVLDVTPARHDRLAPVAGAEGADFAWLAYRQLTGALANDGNPSCDRRALGGLPRDGLLARDDLGPAVTHSLRTAGRALWPLGRSQDAA